MPGALFAILFVYLTVPLGSIFTPPSQQIVNGMAANDESRLIKLALLGISMVMVARQIPLVRALLREVNAFFLGFLVLVPLSYVWSISPSDTLARYVSILCIVGVCAAYCTSGWHPLRFQSVLRPTITLLLVASVIFVLTNPDLGIEHGIGTLKDSWQGLLAQKNPFGELASFGVIFWLHAGLWRQVKAWKALAGGALAGWCLVMSRSSTSLLATVFAAAFLLTLLRPSPALRRYMPYLISAFAVLVVAYALAVLQLVPGSGLLLRPITLITGKDMTFSNRSEIWEIIREHIALRPLLGSGYGAYWTGPVPSSASYTFLSRMGFYPSESHNGYLEIVNDLGYVGLICLGGYLYMYLRQSLQVLRADRAQGALFLALFFQQALINLSESCWLHIDAGFTFVTMTLATIALARTLTDQKRSSRATIGPLRRNGFGWPRIVDRPPHPGQR